MSQITELVDPDRIVGVAPEEYQPFATLLPAGSYDGIVEGVRKTGYLTDRQTNEVNGIWVLLSILVTHPDLGTRTLTFLASTAAFKSRRSSGLDDILQQLNVKPYPRTIVEYQTAVAELAGTTLPVFVDREADNYKLDKNHPQRRAAKVTGESNFELLPDGTRSVEVKCPVTGEPLVARNIITRIVRKRDAGA